jgi:hypothetical protein
VKAKTVKEVLVAMEWIIDHVGWTRGVMYRRKDGGHCSSSKEALDNAQNLDGVCLVGANNLVETEDNGYVLKREANNHLRNSINITSLITFNDRFALNKQEVLEAIRKAIRELP